MGLVTQTAFADGGPEPPVNPKSTRECDNWMEEYHGYLNQLSESRWQCFRDNSHIPVHEWISAGCGPVQVAEPPPCVDIVEQHSCEVQKFGPMITACRAAAHEAESASKPDDLSHDLLAQTASGVPRVAATNAMRMANLLANQGELGASKSALIQSAAKAYGTTAFFNKFYTLYDPGQSLDQKLRALARLVPDTAFGKNLLAQDMLKTALAGLTATNQTALDNLVRELNAFSARIARDNEAASHRAVEEAKAEQDRRAAERRSADEAEKRRLAKLRRIANERAASSPQASPIAPQQPAVQQKSRYEEQARQQNVDSCIAMCERTMDDVGVTWCARNCRVYGGSEGCRRQTHQSCQSRLD